MSLQQQLRNEHIARRADWFGKSKPDLGIDLKRIPKHVKVRPVEPSSFDLVFRPIRPRIHIKITCSDRAVRLPINSIQPPPIQKSLSIERIMSVVARYYNISYYDIMGRSRRQKFSHPRMVGVYLGRRLLHPRRAQYSAMGARLWRDPTTLLDAERAVAARMLKDAGLAFDVATLETELTP